MLLTILAILKKSHIEHHMFITFLPKHLHSTSSRAAKRLRSQILATNPISWRSGVSPSSKAGRRWP